ncbi:MAG: hypothetical protein AAFU54_02335 [Chloroflexota bacterium]
MNYLNRREERNKAAKKIKQLFERKKDLVVIHYSCESFFDRVDGTSPRITSIAVLRPYTRQARSFSIHQMSEINEIPMERLSTHYDDVEKQMLDAFYQFVSMNGSRYWVHWNMRDSNYGFEAIAHRYRVLGGQPVTIDEDRLFDFSYLLKLKYGRTYIGKPNLKQLMDRNDISSSTFMLGAAEAIAFEKQEYVKLHQSTLRKVNVIHELLELEWYDDLQTDASWIETYGYDVGFWIDRIMAHWLFKLVVVILVGFVLAVAGFALDVIDFFSSIP